MYYIITLSTGQPIILYQERESVYLYTITNGKINTKKLLFNDYKEKMIVLNNNYIFYHTINNQSKFFKISNNGIKKLFDLPNNTKVLTLKEDVFIFYEINNSLYCIKCSSFNKSTLLLKDINRFNVFIYDHCIFVENDNIFYKLLPDIKLSKIEYFSNEVSSLKFERNALQEQCKNLENKVGKLQDMLRKYRYTN